MSRKACLTVFFGLKHANFCVRSLGKGGMAKRCAGIFCTFFRSALQSDFLVFSLKLRKERQKQMKRTIKNFGKLSALLLALIMAFSLVACQMPDNDDDGNITDKGKMTLVIERSNSIPYEVNLNDVKIEKGLVSVLDYLKTEGKLDYSMNGTMIDSVGELKNDAAKGEYIYIYTSVTEDADVSQWAKTVEYKGQTLVSSGVGAAEMHD